jgi:transposase
MDRDLLAQWLEEGLSLEAIGRRVGRHPSTVSYWIEKHGLAAANRDRHAARGGIARDVLEQLVAQNLTVREIAAELGRSPATVRHWLRRHELETTRTARIRAKREAGVGERFMATCPRHGPREFIVRGDNTSQCVRCRAEAVSKRRRRVKAMLVAEAGGRCVRCGYDRCPSALQFHHLEPGRKRFGLSSRGVTLSIATLRAEAEKCVLLCANCHAEVEAGVANLLNDPTAPADHSGVARPDGPG